MATRLKRYQLSLNERVLNEIKQFQQENHFGTMSGAMIELIRIGLETVKLENMKK